MCRSQQTNSKWCKQKSEVSKSGVQRERLHNIASEMVMEQRIDSPTRPARNVRWCSNAVRKSERHPSDVRSARMTIRKSTIAFVLVVKRPDSKKCEDFIRRLREKSTNAQTTTVVAMRDIEVEKKFDNRYSELDWL
jgi:hypothetical protein